MRREKCPHGIYFYPGLAEKEKCCGVCRSLAASVVSERRIEEPVPPPPVKVVQPVPKPVPPPVVKSVTPPVKVVPSVPKPAPTVVEPISLTLKPVPCRNHKAKAVSTVSLIVSRDVEGAYDPLELKLRGGNNLNGRVENFYAHHREIMKKGQSQYYGVYWNDRAGKWAAKPKAYCNGKNTGVYLGNFVTAEEAAEAVNRYLRSRNPDDPRINVIRSERTPNPKWGKVLKPRCYGIGRHGRRYKVRLTNKETNERCYLGVFDTLLEAGRAANKFLMSIDVHDSRILPEEFFSSSEAEQSVTNR